MNFTEAGAIVTALHLYRGKVMKPFLSPVKDFIIVPAGQNEFDAMINDIQNNGTSLKEAIKPYRDDVAILVCFDVKIQGNGPAYCHYDYFLFDNNISL